MSPRLKDTEIQQVIRSLSGHWDIEFTIRPSVVLPKGGNGHGTEVWLEGPGGLSLIEEYHSVGDDGDSTGHGVFWWDKALSSFQVLWCANDLPSGCMLISNGATWKDERLILEHRWALDGKAQLLREIFSDITSTSFTQTIYAGDANSDLQVQYVIHASKKR